MDWPVSARLLDGKSLAQTLRGETAQHATRFREKFGRPPCLVVIIVGDDAASSLYVRNKERAAATAGIDGSVRRLPATTSQRELLDLLAELGADDGVDGILVQLPLPDSIDGEAVLDAINPEKDVDGFHVVNVGRMCQGRETLLPCTPYGVQVLLHREGIAVTGKNVVILGRSDIVGRPLANLLSQKDCALGPNACNATVTLAHSRTTNLLDVCRGGEILVAAIGKANFVTADMVRPGAVVIDVGINRVGDRFVGDVDFEAVLPIASAITPVPGGIGPMTIAMLLENTVLAAERRLTAQSNAR